MITYKETRNEETGVVTLVAFNPDAAEPLKTINGTHPAYAEIRAGLAIGADVWSLFDVAKGVMAKLSKISDRFSYDGANILFDGDVRSDVIAEVMLRMLQSGDSRYEALAKFAEKLESNPQEHSREQAYDWLASHDFMITPDGDVLGYKGVTKNADGTFSSTFASGVSGVPSGYVNGAPVKPLSYITQKVGDEVSMPRSEVVHDPTQACKRGLHVGTHNYAKSYGDANLLVTFNPRDLVSVPTDGGGEKIRVCRYKVITEVTGSNEPFAAANGSPVVDTGNVHWTGVGYTGV